MVGRFSNAMNPVYRLFATLDSLAPTVLRMVLAAVFAVHGGQQTFGWMGGEGWSATLQHWTNPDGMNLSYPAAVLGILAEPLGALGMLTGFMTRFAALGILGTMIVAISEVPRQHGFPAPQDFAYPFTLAGVALALMIGGGGYLSVDRVITRALLPPNTGRLGSYRLPLV